MEIHLVVVKPFDAFLRGDVITDSARISNILSGERAHYVVRVAARRTLILTECTIYVKHMESKAMIVLSCYQETSSV